MGTRFDQVKGTAKPLHRALENAGYPDLESLHGVGKRGLERLQTALVERGLGMAGHTGKSAPDIKTKPTEVDPVDYIETPRRVEHGRQLLEIFHRATGAQPVMWGPSMIGYGEVHYESHTGREGDWFRVGFSPRKAKISLYGLRGSLAEEQLGKHTVGAGCIYINKPEDIDVAVLEEMIADAWRR